MKLALIVLLASATAFAAPAGQLAKDRVAAAEKVFRTQQTLWKSNRSTVELVYQWSVRWLGAELDAGTPAKQALADHLGRMTDLVAAATELFNKGQVTRAETEAAAFFRIEAELWDVKGKR